MSGSTIVITGAGVVSAIGIGKSETLKALVSGTTGIGPLRYLETIHRDLPAGEVKLADDELRAAVGKGEEPFLNRNAMLGRLALGEAIKEARLTRDDISAARLVSGTTVGCMDHREQYYEDEKGCDHKHATLATQNCATCTAMTARPFGKFASLATVSTACSSAANAIIIGADMIRCGMTDIAVVGGAESLTRFHLNGFNTLMILDHEQCRPFDKDRAGLNLGEGAAYLVIETLESARKRNVEPLCVLSGYANCCDAYHQTASSPDGEGAYRAMSAALRMAGIRPSDIDYVNAHGTGTPNNDESETCALRRLFGDSMPPVSSTKSFTGHTTSASGTIEAVICLLAMQHQFLPPSLNWRNAMDNGIVPVTDSTPRKEIVNILSNAFGFGGNDSSLVFTKYKETR